ncbi:MAG TPA: hypothetical protein VGN26_24615 [Armatimonadota bacterium]
MLALLSAAGMWSWHYLGDRAITVWVVSLALVLPLGLSRSRTLSQSLSLEALAILVFLTSLATFQDSATLADIAAGRVHDGLWAAAVLAIHLRTRAILALLCLALVAMGLAVMPLARGDRAVLAGGLGLAASNALAGGFVARLQDAQSVNASLLDATGAGIMYALWIGLLLFTPSVLRPGKPRRD